MKIAVVGFGFVGKATFNGLNNDVETLLIDPKLDTCTKQLEAFNPNFVFVCVPTPMGENGCINANILMDVLNDIDKYCPETITIIKSTVTPDIIKSVLCSKINFVYNPEFLRERTADEDFINSKMIILGGNKENCKKVADMYKNYTKCKCNDYQFMPADKASLFKYTVNSFLATKVLFFNEINNLFSKLDSNMIWQDFISVLQLDSRMGDSHMDVPGPDGRYGFGGACFPKDTSALNEFSKIHGSALDLLEKAIEKNNSIRSSYKNLDDREKEQNVQFNKK
jgi:nucleotide sugar dehydrogenase